MNLSSTLFIGAMLVLTSSAFAQNVGIGTTVPTARLHIAGTFRLVDGTQAAGDVLTSDASGNASWQPVTGGGGTLDYAYDFGGAGMGRTITADVGAVLIQGTDGLGITGMLGTGTMIVAGNGPRMYFNPNKAAFRAGYAVSASWDNANVGTYSTAMGYGTTASNGPSTALGNATVASGYASTTTGSLTTASGGYSTAMGEASVASGYASTAMGSSTDAIGDYSTAMGASTNASGFLSTAMGSSTNASGDYSTAMGSGTTASGEGSTAMGYVTNATGEYSTSIGGPFTTASGDYAIAIGEHAYAESGFETALGRWNTDYVPVSTTGWDPIDRLLVVGNGTSSGARSDALTILKNGNTGIGVSSPTQKLEIGGTSSQLYMNSVTSNHLTFNTEGVNVPTTTVRSAGTKIVFYPQVSATEVDYAMGINGYTLWYSIPAATSAYQHQFYAGTSPLVTIRGDGAVGVGTTTPRGHLDVDGAGDIYLVDDPNAGTTQSLFMPGHTYISPYNGSNIAYLQARRLNDAGTVALRLRTSNAGVVTEAVHISGAGDVGIGTISPLTKLHVHGTNTWEEAFTLYTNNTTGASLGDGFIVGTNPSGAMVWNLEATPLSFLTSSIERMTILAGGNVGIGTIAPAYTLEVSNTAAKPGGGTWIATSDARLKLRVVPYTDGLSELLNINPVRFNYNELSGHDTTVEYVGVIAQELQEVAPYMVGQFEKKGEEYLNVDNSAMIYMLINAIKEQQEQIDALKEALRGR